ncbi:MAG: hypothetical protein JXA00_03740 [Candidatus Thermoplasmatota archaeon]|nr:hypothetical protein [Candidatus Thermoplasmatota archaeon]
MKKITLVVVVISVVLAGMPLTTALPMPHLPSAMRHTPPTPAPYTNDTPPDWATGNFSGVWGITIFGIPLPASGWITGYYQRIGLGNFDAVYATFNETNATSFLRGIMLWIFFLGGAGSLATGNATWVSGIGVANQTHFYWRINAIIGPSFYIHCEYTPFENTTRSVLPRRLLH